LKRRGAYGIGTLLQNGCFLLLRWHGGRHRASAYARLLIFLRRVDVVVRVIVCPRPSRAMRFLFFMLAAVSALAAAGAGATGGRLAVERQHQGSVSTALPFSLTFNGEHVSDPNLPAGIRHQGRFTASPPACSSGTASDVRDVQLEPLSVLREYRCDDGSGTFTALLPTAAGEHGRTGGWKIVGGTGSFALLRGIGTYTGTILSGDPNDFLSVKYRTDWRGTAGFDGVPPTVALQASAHRRLL
jgi:hypothetical protein